MPKKNKQTSQRHKHRQQKQQRRSQRVHKRSVDLNRPIQHESTSSANTLAIVADLKRFLGSFGEQEPTLEMTEQLFALAYESDSLLDEPEFENIAIEPLLAVTTFITSAGQLGVEGSDGLGQLEEEKRLEIGAEINDLTSEKLFDPELRQQVSAALTRLRRRWRAAGKIDKLEIAAATQFFIDNDPEGKVGHTTGIVRALVQRAIANGFDFSQALQTDNFETEGLSALEVHNRIKNRDTSGLEVLLQRPGMTLAVDKQMDMMWEAAKSALLRGDLNLGIYSETELDGADEIFRELQAKYDFQPNKEDEKNAFFGELTTRLMEYLRTLFTPERASLLKEQIEQVVNDPEFGGTPFVMYLVDLYEDLQEEFDFDFFSVTLLNALVGEVGWINSQREDEER